MSLDRTCPKCGTALSEGTLGGLCRRCLGRLAFAVEPDGTAADDGAALPACVRFGDYELLQEIARGGMGVVYKARQLSLQRLVAVKMLLHGPFSSEAFVQRFHTEAKAAAAMHHPNIVAIYDVGQLDGQHYFSMEYIEGENLGELVREKPLPARRAAVYVKAVAEAIQYAHERGVLHRDLKPSNILLDAFDQPRIADFGLAKLLTGESQLTVAGQTLGSPSHMPPEQAAGRPATTPAGDIYSIGAILYQLVTGRPPFQGETVQDILRQVQNTEPVHPRRLIPTLPADLETICLKCLQKEPPRRYGSAGELAEDLGHFLSGEPIRARAVGRVERFVLGCRRRPIFAALWAGLLAAVLLGLTGVFWQWRRAEQHARAESQLRRQAERSAETLKLNLYAADVNLASEAIQGGDYGLARRTLAGLKPRPGEDDLRGFEWRYLWNICQGDQVATLSGHAWIVTCAAFSPDGKSLASGSEDQTVKIWNPQTSELLTTLAAATGSVRSVAFSSDGHFLVTSGRGGTRLWDTGTWRLITNFPGQVAALAKKGDVLAVSESSPFDWRGSRGQVSLWNPRTCERLRILPNAGHALAFSADGGTLAVAANPSGIDLYQVESGECFRRIATARPVWTMDFSPDGSQLVATTADRDALLWVLNQGGQPQSLAGHSLTVWSAIFSPDGATIVTTSSDQTIRHWDAASLKLKGILHGHNHEVWCAAFSPDGLRLATGGKDQNVMLWSAQVPARRNVFPHRNGLRTFFSPDAAYLVTLGSTAGVPSALWELRTRALAGQIPGRPALGLSPDGHQVVRWSDDNTSLQRSPTDHLGVSNIPLQEIRRCLGPIHRQGFSPDWKIFYAIDSEGVVRFWNAETGRLLDSLRGPKPPIRSTVLSADATLFALGASRERTVRIYDRQTGYETQLTGHADSVSGLAFSTDGTILASGSLDGTIRLWNPRTGRCLTTLPGHMEETSGVAFSPDGRTLASVNLRNSIKFWHVPTGRQLLILEFPHAGDLLEFSPDGRYLVVTTDENSVRLFEAPPLAEMERTGL